MNATTNAESSISLVLIEPVESSTSDENIEAINPATYNVSTDNLTNPIITEIKEFSEYDDSNTAKENIPDAAESFPGNQLLPSEEDTYTEPEINPEVQKYIDDYKAKEQDIYSRADNITPPDQLITKFYTANEMINRYGAYFSARTYSGNTHPIVSVDEKYPIECLRDMGGGSYYVVYNIEEGGRMFLFFPADANGLFSYGLYLRKPLDKSRFEQLKPGDTLEPIVDIDSSLEIVFNKKIESLCNVVAGAAPNIIGTYHFFNDSLWFIKYENLNDEDVTIKTFKTKKVKILEINKFNDKKLVIKWEFLYEGVTYPDGVNGTYDFNILPIDYPE